MPPSPPPTSEDLSCAVATVGPAADVVVSGEVDLATALVLADALRHAEDHPDGMVVDLSGVEFMDCRGAQLLLATARRVRANGGQLRLAGASDIVTRLFRVMGITGEFDPGLRLVRTRR